MGGHHDLFRKGEKINPFYLYARCRPVGRPALLPLGFLGGSASFPPPQKEKCGEEEGEGAEERDGDFEGCV